MSLKTITEIHALYAFHILWNEKQLFHTKKKEKKESQIHSYANDWYKQYKNGSHKSRTNGYQNNGESTEKKRQQIKMQEICE